ncbi:ABC-2 family transporter protein [compost metagenome]
MLNAIQSENLKYKRSFSQKLVFIAPLFFALYAIIVKLLISAVETPWDLFLCMVFNWWPLIFIPLGTALLCALVEMRERKAGNYRCLRTYNLNASTLWFGKITVLAFYTLLSSVTLIFVTLIAGSLIAQGTAPIGKIVEAGAIIWLVSLSLIPIQLFAAAWKGTIAAVALGFCGLFAGVIAAPRPWWIFVPWSWPMRLMSPIIGVHPNGIPLQEGDPLLNDSVVPLGIVVSLAFLAATSVLTAIWFAKREVR